MKKLFLLVGAAALVACAHDRDRDSGATMNEPAGAATTNSMQSMPARDVNQQPYPGSSDLNQQRGSGSSSDSSLQGSSSSSGATGASSGDSTGSGSSTSSGSSSQNP